jgi:hypothetical protein
MKKSVVAAVSVAFLVITSSVASAQVCTVGVLVAAIVANASEHRELTQKEALSCGLLLGQDKPEPKAKKVAHHKSHAKKPKT